MVSATELTLKFVCPIAGGVLSTIMFAAPIRDVYDATRVGHLGNLNTTPWVFMLGNCYGWVLYGFITNNLIIYCFSGLGFLIALWLNLQAVKLQYVTYCRNEWSQSLQKIIEDEEASRDLFTARNEKSQESRSALGTTTTTTEVEVEANHKSLKGANADETSKLIWEMITEKTLNAKPPVAHENMVMGIAVAWIIATSVVCYAKAISHTTQEIMVGVIVNVNLIFFHAAPLSTTYTVLRTQSSATIHGPTVLLKTTKGIVFLIYGIALLDFFIIVPNGIGALLGLTMMLMQIVFPAGKPSQKAVENQEASETSVADTSEFEDNNEMTDV